MLLNYIIESSLSSKEVNEIMFDDLMKFIQSPTGQLFYAIRRDHIVPHIRTQMMEKTSPKPMTKDQERQKADEDFIDIEME